MKWFQSSIAAVAALVLSTGMATPLPQADDRINIYKLRVASNISLDGKYLGIRNDEVGIYDGPSARPAQFYPREGPNKGLVELHTYPIGIVDSVLGLVGTNGLLTFTDISSPESVNFPVGTHADWTSFDLQTPAGDDRAGARLTYGASRTGKWVAFPVGGKNWKVTWLEGSAYVIQNYMPIEIIYEPANERDIGGYVE